MPRDYILIERYDNKIVYNNHFWHDKLNNDKAFTVLAIQQATALFCPTYKLQE